MQPSQQPDQQWFPHPPTRPATEFRQGLIIFLLLLNLVLVGYVAYFVHELLSSMGPFAPGFH